MAKGWRAVAVGVLIAWIGALSWLSCADSETPGPTPPPAVDAQPEVPQAPRSRAARAPTARVVDAPVEQGPAPPEANPKSPDPVLLEVQATMSGGVPAAGARVRVLEAHAPHFGAALERVQIDDRLADAQGRARFELRQRSFVSVHAECGREAGVSPRVRLRVGAATRVAVELRPAVAVEGRVVSDSGWPIPGAYVQMHLDVPGSPFGLAVGANTGAEGTFALPALPEELLVRSEEAVRRDPLSQPTLTASAKGHTTRRRPVPADPRGRLVEILLRSASAVRGRLVDAEGRPLADGTLWMSNSERRARTGADGKFVLDDLPREGGDLRAAAPGVAPLVVEGIRGDAGDVDLGDLVMLRGGRVHGTVVGSDGAPVDSVEVTLWCGVTGGAQQAVAATFDFRHVGAGTHELEVREVLGPGEHHAGRTCRVRSVTASDEPLRVVLSGAGSIHVRLVSDVDRAPLSADSVQIVMHEPENPAGTHHAHRSGGPISAVRVTPEHAGVYDLTIHVPGYETTTVHGVEVHAGRETRIEVRVREAR